MLLRSVDNSLEELSDLIEKLDNTNYSRPCPALNNASIGEHSRHIIEMFQCLDQNYDSGVINYDNRQRNGKIEVDTAFAKACLSKIRESLAKPDKKLQLRQIIDSEEIRLESNYNRELLYNLEHCIHHQALIKVALHGHQNISVSPSFGVARSTIEYRNQCAQ